MRKGPCSGRRSAAGRSKSRSARRAVTSPKTRWPRSAPQAGRGGRRCAVAAPCDAAAGEGAGRSVRLPIGSGTVVLIDESYNANPASMRAAIALLEDAERRSGGRRIAVLGDMLEMGELAGKVHAGLVGHRWSSRHRPCLARRAGDGASARRACRRISRRISRNCRGLKPNALGTDRGRRCGDGQVVQGRSASRSLSNIRSSNGLPKADKLSANCRTPRCIGDLRDTEARSPYPAGLSNWRTIFNSSISSGTSLSVPAPPCSPRQSSSSCSARG